MHNTQGLNEPPQMQTRTRSLDEVPEPSVPSKNPVSEKAQETTMLESTGANTFSSLYDGRSVSEEPVQQDSVRQDKVKSMPSLACALVYSFSNAVLIATICLTHCISYEDD